MSSADLDLHIGLGVHQRLRIGVHRDELHTLEVFLDHAVHGVAAAASHTHHFHAGVLGSALFELEGHPGELHTGLWRPGVKVAALPGGTETLVVECREHRRHWRSALPTDVQMWIKPELMPLLP